jgi:hypothetical protein
MIKILHKKGIEENFLNMMKAIYGMPTANIVFSGRKLTAFILRSCARQDAYSHHFYSTQYLKYWQEQSGKKKK